MSLAGIFIGKVAEDPSGCWLWMGTTNDQGYGRVSVDGQPRYAHRLAYEAFAGPIPNGLEIDHLCRTPGCVNPAHLEAVTHRENILRGTSPFARSARATHCIHGHPLSGDNLYIRPDGTGRQCKRCSRIRYREARLRQREELRLRGTSPPARGTAAMHCIHGHPFDEHNTIQRRDGKRDCRACLNRRQGEYRARRRAAVR